MRFFNRTFNKQKEVSDFVKIKKHFFYGNKIKLKNYLSMKMQIHNNLTTQNQPQMFYTVTNEK